jgi:hypothetical protein
MQQGSGRGLGCQGLPVIAILARSLSHRRSRSRCPAFIRRAQHAIWAAQVVSKPIWHSQLVPIVRYLPIGAQCGTGLPTESPPNRGIEATGESNPRPAPTGDHSDAYVTGQGAQRIG